MDGNEKDSSGIIFLETCHFPSIIQGVRRYDGNEILFAGIKGFDDRYERNGNISNWFSGEITSPTIRGNHGCSSMGHIEGIITERGELIALESIYDFLALGGDCFEYKLKAEDLRSRNPKFIGEIIARRRGKKFPYGTVDLNLIGYNPKDGMNSLESHSLPYSHMRSTCGWTLPDFWKTFLGEIEEQGYDHPYGAITDKLKKERENARRKDAVKDFNVVSSDHKKSSLDGDLPF